VNQSKINILIVEDNKEFSNLLAEYLSRHQNFKVLGVANDGVEAFRLVQELSPDLLLLDMIMPHMDGLGVLEKLSSIKISHLPKIVVLSALGQDRITQRALELGADYYIIKPFDMDVLAQRIMQMFNDNSTDMITKREMTTNEILKETSDFIIYSDLESQITDIMHEIGIPAHIKGYLYIRNAIDLVVNDVEMMSMTKVLYPAIAQRFNTTPNKVERAIRHAIEIAWSRGKGSTLNSILGHAMLDISDKPTNAHFIASIADTLRLKNKTS
jgi:two-component system, response regulator, stage 0 sporulation protein A